jgi:phosphoribosyl-ATP pyrophosphohydrolase
MTDPISRLHAAIIDCRDKEPAGSRTAKLLNDGIPKMAKKLAEEAVEVSLDAVVGKRNDVILESVDLIYNLTVLWTAMDVKPQDVWDEMDRRERLYGICEKLPKIIAD